MSDVDLSKAVLKSRKFYGTDLSPATLPSDNGAYPHHRESVCYHPSRKWPPDFPVEDLPELQCDEMKQDP
ncbi:hypothetical protein ABL57_02600 [Kocuria sp. SM24M-10]|nr:hypothetical protein ABL57_02600 [Kocuria sp. SM24M-10]